MAQNNDPQHHKKQNDHENHDDHEAFASQEKHEDHDAKKEAEIKKCYAIIRWTIAGFFSLLALASGLHISILFFFSAAFLMLPFPIPLKGGKQHAMIIIQIVISCVLFFIGAFLTPEDPLYSTSLDGYDVSLEDFYNEMSTENITDNDTEEVSTPGDDLSDTEITEESETTPPLSMVWVSASGTKYHASSTCSSMKTPQKISLEIAIQNDYTPCQRCIKSD